jgi:serine/threonine protein phosphatase PrpC
MDRLRKKATDEYSNFDISLSGTSATLMIQTNKKIFIAWVGDCHAVMCKKERKVLTIKLTQ